MLWLVNQIKLRRRADRPRARLPVAMEAFESRRLLSVASSAPPVVKSLSDTGETKVEHASAPKSDEQPSRSASNQPGQRQTGDHQTGEQETTDQEVADHTTSDQTSS